MKKLIFLFILLIFSVITLQAQDKNTEDKNDINTSLNQWHQAATDADFDKYFSFFADDAVFIGTDANENWTLEAFKEYAHPYFERGKAWSFTVLNRNVYFSNNGKTAWFDELLDTQMKICRGSGVLVKERKGWRIKHYVLSMTIPNEVSKAVIQTKTIIEDKTIEEIKGK